MEIKRKKPGKKNLGGLGVYGNQEEKPGRKNLAGLGVYGNQEEKPGRIGNQEESGPRENVSIVWEGWKFMEIKRKLDQEKIRM